MKRRLSPVYTLLGVVIVCGGCGWWRGTTQSAPTATPALAGPVTPRWGMQSKTSECVVRGHLPDPGCTPGDLLFRATVRQVCTSGYASAERNVSQSLKRQVYAEYGITRRLPGQYEVDHLVNLSIGGSNDLANLWPQPATPVPGYREKNQVENYLHDQVCSGAIPIQQAQIEIATNWLDVYERMPKK